MFRGLIGPSAGDDCDGWMRAGVRARGVFYLPAPARCQRIGWRGGGRPGGFRSKFGGVYSTRFGANAKEFNPNKTEMSDIALSRYVGPIKKK